MILLETKKIEISVLCEYIRSIDYEDRDIKFIESLSNKDFDEIISLLDACLVEEQKEMIDISFCFCYYNAAKKRGL